MRVTSLSIIVLIVHLFSIQTMSSLVKGVRRAFFKPPRMATSKNCARHFHLFEAIET